MSGPAADLAHRLARDAEGVCRHYLSSGRREGRYWIVGDVHNTRGRSLYVRLTGPDAGPGAAGKWVDAATGEHGDLLDLIRLACGLADVRAAMEEARTHLVLERAPLPSQPKRYRSKSDAARWLFSRAMPIAGTPALRYLRARGITAELDGFPLRYHPACFHRLDAHSAVAPLPALLAAATDTTGAITGIQRTWLDPASLKKADVPTPRKALGRLYGYGVRFGGHGDVVVVGEGLETMLSLKSVLPTLPMVACLSAGNLGGLVLPPTVRRLYVARDNDPAGVKAFLRLCEREDLGTIEIRALVPNHKDFNDDLCRDGPVNVLARLREQLAPEDIARFAPSDWPGPPADGERAVLGEGSRDRERERPAGVPHSAPGRLYMTDKTTTATYDAGTGSQADYDAEAAAARATNKTVAFAALARAGITHVNVRFDGCGDSGQIEDVEALVNGRTVDLPADQVEIREVRWDYITTSSTLMSVREAVEEIAYACLDQVQSGWENGDGAYGDFVFNVADQTIALEFGARFTGVDTSNHSF